LSATLTDNAAGVSAISNAAGAFAECFYESVQNLFELRVMLECWFIFCQFWGELVEAIGVYCFSQVFDCLLYSTLVYSAGSTI
jgi:hypothetical protein